jgi:hypothetical protein
MKMGQRYSEISDKLTAFIQAQKIFFVGTATSDSTVNVSPKGMDSLRVVNKNRIVWLNVTGSGNETAAHVLANPRMTLMFCAFAGDPLILRIYGQARAIHPRDAEWKALFSLFDPLPGARQIFDLAVDLVQTSCGMAIPFFDYANERGQLINWAEKKGQAGVEAYWEEKNQTSIDGLPTGIVLKKS